MIEKRTSMNTGFNGESLFGTHIPQHEGIRDHAKMQEVLMNPEAQGPSIHYHMIRDEKNPATGKGNNITIWEAGKVGGEYIKTYGHYHIGDLDETYKVISGEGIIILQELAVGADGKMIPDRVVKFIVKPVNEGDEVFIPANYGHLAVNTGNRFFVTWDDSPVNFEGKANEASMPGHADYEMVKRTRGFAYYVVEGKDGKPALVRNKLYKDVQGVETAGLPILS